MSVDVAKKRPARSTPVPTERPVSAAVHREALQAGFSPIQARILAGRLSDSYAGDLRRHLRPKAADLTGPEDLPDIEIAALLLADAIAARKPIALVTDHDADGATSNAILRLSMQGMGYPQDALSSFLSHRLNEGYGISDRLVDRMLPALQPATCIVTADQGSTDELRIARLREAGHTVVVTDHHGISDAGPPPSANAVVNPILEGSRFPDKHIAGCHTALLVMAAARLELIKRRHLPEGSPRMSRLLDICAVGTVADAVTMAHSRNNRLIVQLGLQLMNAGGRPAWEALRQILHKESAWTAEDIAFQIAPRINARGRLSDAMLGVEFLCADTLDEAHRLALQLDADNQERRTIEKALTRLAMQTAEEAVGQGRIGLCLWLGDGSHPGVHGITASRIVEHFGRPTICLSPAQDDPFLATGSIRTTEQVDVRHTLTRIQKEWPGLLITAGGHRGAGGLRLARRDIETLADAWDICVRDDYGSTAPVSLLWTDGEIDSSLNMGLVQEIAALSPYGRQFESPVFTGRFKVVSIQPMGDGTHLRLKLRNRLGEIVEGVWFGAVPSGETAPVAANEDRFLAFSLEANEFRGQTKLQMQVRCAFRAVTTLTHQTGVPYDGAWRIAPALRRHYEV